MKVNLKDAASTKKYNTEAKAAQSGCQSWSCTSNCGSGTGHKCSKQIKTQISNKIKDIYSK